MTAVQKLINRAENKVDRVILAVISPVANVVSITSIMHVVSVTSKGKIISSHTTNCQLTIHGSHRADLVVHLPSDGDASTSHILDTC